MGGKEREGEEGAEGEAEEAERRGELQVGETTVLLEGERRGEEQGEEGKEFGWLTE